MAIFLRRGPKDYTPSILPAMVRVEMGGAMYCPKCGATLVTRRDAGHGASYLYCEPGKMGLSLKLQDVLDHRYGENAPPSIVQRPRPISSPTYPHEWGWYCPCCGVPLNGWLECPHCGKHLRDLAYQLVELHPHLPPQDAPSRIVAQVLGPGRSQEKPDRVELQVAVYGEPPRLGLARLRTRSGAVRPVRVVDCVADETHSDRQSRRALVVVEDMARGELQAGDYLEQEPGSDAQDHERQASGERRPDAE